MRKTYLFGILIALFSVLSSCQKEDSDTVNLKAEAQKLGGNSKVFIDSDNYVCWEDGDRIRLGSYGTGLGTGIYAISVDGDGNASISGVKYDSRGYRAVYPTSLGYANPTATPYTSIKLPATQNYNAANPRKIETPMVGYAANSAETMKFRHVCALLKVVVTGNIRVTSIVVSADVPLCGTGSINHADEENPYLVLNDGQPQSVMLNCGNGVDVAGSKDFYIVIPQITNASNKFTITVNGEGVTEKGEVGSAFTKSQTRGGSTILRGQIGTVPFTISNASTEGTGRLVGKFKISANQTVSFSKGNLRHNNGTWSFAENQFDYIGSANQSAIEAGSGLIDLFGWGTSGNSTFSPYNYYGNSGSAQTYYPYGTSGLRNSANDWGHNAISNGGNQADQWFTLTAAEWNYIFANHTYKWASVNGVSGIIILPYGMSGTINSSYSESAWNDLAVDGAVFLPAAGYRNGTTNGSSASVISPGSRGFYWTATNSGNEAAYYLGFKSDTNPIATNSTVEGLLLNPTRFRGGAVRLVQYVE